MWCVLANGGRALSVLYSVGRRRRERQPNSCVGGAPAPLVRPPRVLPHFSVLMRMVLLSLAACAYGLPSGKPNALLAKSDGHTSWEDSAPGGGGMTAFTL